MALINGIYVFVKEESVDYAMDVTSHPVEKGINISDHARRQPYSISLQGEIVGNDAAKKRAQIESLMNNSALIYYQGRNVKSNGLIINFKTDHPNTINGGCAFDMTIKEVRIANSSGYLGNTTPTKANTTPLKEPQETGTQKIEKNTSGNETYTTQNGDSIYDQLVTDENNDYAEILSNNANVNPQDVEANTTITVKKTNN